QLLPARDAQRRQPLTKQAMQAGTGHLRELPIHGLAIEGVPKLVVRGDGSVGQLLKAGRRDELMALDEAFTDVLDLLSGELRRPERPHGEAIAGNAGPA